MRSKYPEHLQPVADYFIDKYKDVDSLKSAEYFQESNDANKAGRDEDALRYLNLAIDANPDNSHYYYLRGVLKLTRMDIDAEMAYSSIKDFDRSVRLNPGYTNVYFHRSIALGYLGKSLRSFNDAKVVWNADSTLSDKEFQMKYGMSKKTFSIPFHS
jgi:tetratricopeptide (TPR) repeat protein